ncbi:MAG: DUF4139 domain-containing protein, partial [Bacteroidota bacterium]
MRLLAIALLALLAMSAAQPADAQPSVVSQPESQDGVALTVYNQNFAVVREVRPITLASGMNRVRFEGVAAMIDPTSISLKSLTAPNSLVVRE